MAGASRNWFRSERSDRAIEDFFDLCDANFDANEVTARGLEHHRGASDTPVAEQVANARVRFRQARAGNWEPFEHHLGQLGARFAREGVALEAWADLSHQFYRALVPRFVAALSAEPQRLTDALLVLGDYMERSVALIASEYQVVAQHVDHELDEEHGEVLEASPDAVIVMDERGSITDLNAAAVKTFGYSRTAAIGRVLADLIIPERLREAHRAGLERVTNTGETRVIGRRVELVALRADGSEIPVELSIIATKRRTGERKFTGFVRDLSDRDQTEASFALWTHALDQAQFGVVVSEISTREIRSVNQAYARMLGYEPAELAGTDGDRLISSMSVPSLTRVAANLEGGGFSTYELALLRRDGSTLPVLASTSTVELRSGRVRVSTVIDISERHALEQARNASLLALEVLAKTAHDFAVASELGPLLELVASRLSTITGSACSVELFGDATGVAARKVESGEQAEARFHLALDLRSRDRKIGVVTLRRDTPYNVAETRLASDLADRASLALDNAILVATLERRVGERTAELENANRELESFSYTVSHDLRSPLRAINGFSRALSDDYADRLDSEAKHYCERIQHGTQRMATLIDDLLNLARIGRVSLRREPVDLSKIATEITNELAQRDPARRVELIIAPEVVAYADARLARVVLENLLANAWKFTAKQEHATIVFISDGHTFEVRDDGAGFDMAHANKLFMPFQRLHTDREFEGSGIGLATVDRIIRHHGGKIWADSEPGHGAIFFFTFEKSQ